MLHLECQQIENLQHERWLSVPKYRDFCLRFWLQAWIKAFVRFCPFASTPTNRQSDCTLHVIMVSIFLERCMVASSVTCCELVQNANMDLCWFAWESDELLSSAMTYNLPRNHGQFVCPLLVLPVTTFFLAQLRIWDIGFLIVRET